jgi:hypothetical protein
MNADDIKERKEENRQRRRDFQPFKDGLAPLSDCSLSAPTAACQVPSPPQPAADRQAHTVCPPSLGTRRTLSRVAQPDGRLPTLFLKLAKGSSIASHTTSFTHERLRPHTPIPLSRSRVWARFGIGHHPARLCVGQTELSRCTSTMPQWQQ